MPAARTNTPARYHTSNLILTLKDDYDIRSIIELFKLRDFGQGSVAKV